MEIISRSIVFFLLNFGALAIGGNRAMVATGLVFWHCLDHHYDFVNHTLREDDFLKRITCLSIAVG
jgi:hypothetical protein